MSPHIASGSQPYFGSGRPSRDAVSAAPNEAPAEPDQRGDQRLHQRHELAEATQALLDQARSVPEPERTRLRDQAVTGYLWLADALAQRFRGRGEEYDDLVQIARSGLVEAAHRYDTRLGSFPAFAAPTITGVLKRHFRDHGWLVRPPRPTQEIVIEMGREWALLTQTLGREPDDRAVATQIGRPLEAVREARLARGGYTACSLDAAFTGGSLADLPTAHDLVEDRLVIAQAWRQLTRSERRLLTMRFFEDRSQADIAAEIGTSQMQVSRLLSRTFRKMRRLIARPDERRRDPRIRTRQLMVGGGRAPAENR